MACCFFNRLGYACKNIKMTKRYDVETEIKDTISTEPLFFVHLKGKISVKIYKLIASLAVLSAIMLTVEIISSICKFFKKKR